MSAHAGDTSTQKTDPQPINPILLTYGDLLAHHNSKYKDELKQKGKSGAAANNYETALNKWLKHAPWLSVGANNGEMRSASLEDPVGAEFGVDFEVQLAEHLRWMKCEGYAASSINSRKHLLGKLQESWFELLNSIQLPDRFSEALDFLITERGAVQRQLAKVCGISDSLLSRWRNDLNVPSRASLVNVSIIEKHLNLQPGTLVFKLPSRLRGQGTTRHTTQNTPYRRHLTQLINKPYRLSYESFSPEQQDEWEKLYRFYTDDGWYAAKGLQRHEVGWRTRENDGKNATAEIKLRYVENYFGFLTLPSAPMDPKLRGAEFNPEDDQHVGVRGFDPHLTGLGRDPQKLSLALFTDAELINDAINFQRARCFGNKHNTYTRNFLAFAAQLTREKVGFLCQFPEFGKRLNPPVLTQAEWSERCREAHERINNIIKRIFGGRKKKHKTPPQSRDTTIEVVKPLIKEREHPISVLHDMAEGLRYDFKRAGTPEDKALLFRNMILVRIVTSNPMRAVNIAEMRYKVGAKGDENEPTNLYKRPDGSYRLKYEIHELKNGEIQGRYDLPVHPDLTEDLDEYFTTWRPLLVGAGECDYIFRPSTEGSRSHLSRRPDFIRRPMSKCAISNTVLCASERYVPDCAGFGIHSARHLVATEFLKHYPGGYDIAATVLHDSVEIVRDAYEWVTPDDKVIFWNDHLTRVLLKLRKEAA